MVLNSPLYLGHDSDAVQDSLVSPYLLGCTATPSFVASRHVVGAWISNKMGTIGVTFRSIVVKFEDPEVYCDHHRSGVLKGPNRKRKDAVQTIIGTLS